MIITGATGFVGAALTGYLATKNIEVIAVSRQRKSGVHYVSSYLDCPPGDMVIHLGEESDRHKANNLGAEYEASAIETTAFLSDAFSGNIIYASSAVVYGDKNSEPNKEDDSVAATDIYSHIKLRNERVVTEHAGSVLRLSNLYGKGMATNNVLSDIISQLDKPGVVTVRDASPVRDFLFIDDLLAAILALVLEPTPGVFNVGSGQGCSIRQLAELLLELTGQADREIISVQPLDSHSVNTLDISKIQQSVGWRPAAAMNQNLSQLF